MIELSIVSGTYQRLRYLQAMVYSARKSLPAGVPYEFIVVDGGSTDGTIEWCKQQQDIRLIEQGELLGAIAAFNAGAYAAKGRYVVLANDDIQFLDSTLTVALAYMHDNPHVGIGAFYQDRSGKAMHVEGMPGMFKDGRTTWLTYGQVCIVQRWLGDKCKWWGLPGAKTYGGDNYLSARAWEAGYPVEAIPGTQIHDATPMDDLRRSNNHSHDGQHPDSRAYLSIYPEGPVVADSPAYETPDEMGRKPRILYAPIYEPGGRENIQRRQKRGLRHALRRVGLVYEVDYVAGQDVVAAAKAWKPDLILTQFHNAGSFTAQQSAALKAACPNAWLVNWNGDYWPETQAQTAYLDMLRNFDLQLVVNASTIPLYASAGIHAAYWQIGYEPDGVGHEPYPHDARHDIVFLANCYSEARRELGQLLSQYKAGIYGASWGTGDTSTLYDFEHGCRLYRGSKLAVGDSQWPDATGFVSNRLFQALAAGGAMLLHQRFDGMEALLGLQDGKHLVIWNDLVDLKKKISYWLDPANENERSRIAQAGQREVLRRHSFDARVAELFAMLEGVTA